MLIENRPASLFMLASFCILIIPFIFWGESLIIDILGFTIFIDGKSAIYFFGILTLFYWGFYKTLNQYLINQPMTWIHITVTLGVITYFLTTGDWYFKSNAENEIQAYMYYQLMLNKERTVKIASPLGIIFIAAQLTLIVNLTLGLTKNK